jgi:glycosyltransferase involved in cell wall biosynthesis
MLIAHPVKLAACLFYTAKANVRSARSLIRMLRHFPSAVFFAATIAGKRITQIHAHFASLPGFLALVVSRLLGISFSITAHARDIYVDTVMLREKLREAALVITCTEYNRRFLETFEGRTSGANVYRVYHGIDPDRFRRQAVGSHELQPDRAVSVSGSSPLRILSVGRLVEKKGFPFLVEACRMLKERGHRIICTIVGDGERKREIIELIQMRHLQDDVSIIDPMPEKMLIRHYQSADVFVLPCIVAGNGDRDGIPNTLIEALSMELPVISTDISAIPELIEHEVTGLLVPQRDAESLAQAVETLASDEALAKRLGQTGREKVISRFNLTRNVDQIAELIGCGETS